MEELPISELAQSVLCANPDGPIVTFKERADAVVGQTILTGVIVEAGLIEMTDTVIGANPEGAVSGFEEDADEVVDQPFVRGEVLCALRGKMEDSAAVRSDPKRSVAAAQYITNPRALQPRQFEGHGTAALQMDKLV